jgi:hypothetical protein
VMLGGARRQEGRTRPEGSRARTRQGCRPRRRQAAKSLEKHTGTIGRAIGRGVRRTGAALKRGWQKLKLRKTSDDCLGDLLQALADLLGGLNGSSHRHRPRGLLETDVSGRGGGRSYVSGGLADFPGAGPRGASP